VINAVASSLRRFDIQDDCVITSLRAVCGVNLICHVAKRTRSKYQKVKDSDYTKL